MPDLYCYGGSIDVEFGTGVCTRFAPRVRSGQVCDLALGADACQQGYYCVGTNGVSGPVRVNGGGVLSTMTTAAWGSQTWSQVGSSGSIVTNNGAGYAGGVIAGPSGTIVYGNAGNVAAQTALVGLGTCAQWI